MNNVEESIMKQEFLDNESLRIVLRDGIKDLLEGNQFPLNREGAAGWVSQDCIWAVSKRFIVSLRETMATVKFKVPRDNSVFLSMLLDLGLIIKAKDDRLIHKVTVSIKTDNDGVVDNNFTVLRVPMNSLWVDKSKWIQQSGIVEVQYVESYEQ